MTEYADYMRGVVADFKNADDISEVFRGYAMLLGVADDHESKADEYAARSIASAEKYAATYRQSAADIRRLVREAMEESAR